MVNEVEPACWNVDLSFDGNLSLSGRIFLNVFLNAATKFQCIDNYYNDRRRNTEHLLTHPLFEALQHDITLSLFVERAEIYNMPNLADPLSIRPPC